jgi:hypothetical protein
MGAVVRVVHVDVDKNASNHVLNMGMSTIFDPRASQLRSDIAMTRVRENR